MPQQRRRSGIIIGLVALGVLVGAALTAHPAQAVSGPGPYYAEPAWEQIKGAGRFLVLTNWNKEAVLDKETGLVWEQSPQTAAANALNARVNCAQKTVGNRKGWRLPAIPELASLVDPSVPSPGPTLPAGHPFTNVQSALYWSATTIADFPPFVWNVSFFNGAVNGSDKATSLQVWCVRGGMNADAY